MNIVFKLIRKNKSLALILIAVLGLFLSSRFRDSTIMSGIGISLVSSSLMSLLLIFFIGDEDDYKAAKEWGLECVYKTRGAMNDSCDDYMSKARFIKAIAFGYKSLRDGQDARVNQMLKEGRSIKLITMKPDCPNLKEREKDEQQDISTSVKQLIEWAQRLNSCGYPGKIEIRYHDHLPSYFVFIMSNRLYTGPYEYKKQSQQTISFEYNTIGGAYDYYDEYFERLWNDPEFCEDALAN